LPEDIVPDSNPSMVYSDGVIDTNSAISMSIPGNNKLILPGDVNHLEQFSQDALQKLAASALRHDNNWYANNGGHPGWVFYNEALGPTTTTYFPTDSSDIYSANNSYELTQQESDGNLVIYENFSRHPLWARPGVLKANAYTAMQDDGNLVTYSLYEGPGTGSGDALWASGTNGNGLSYAALQDDGNLVIIKSPNFTSNLIDGRGAFGGPVTWSAFSGPNSPIASINPIQRTADSV